MNLWINISMFINKVTSFKFYVNFTPYTNQPQSDKHSDSKDAEAKKLSKTVK